MCARTDFANFVANTLHTQPAFPASETALVEWSAQHFTAGKTYHSVKRDFAVLKSWHVDLGLPISSFDSEQLARVVRGYRQVAGNPAPSAKWPITLPLLPQLVQVLPSVCTSQHNKHMFRAAFCLAFACFLCSGEITWQLHSSPSLLTIGSVSFAPDFLYTTVHLAASKTDPFGQGVILTAPVVPHSICPVRSLQVICRHRLASEPLFILKGGLPFDRNSFISMLYLCLQACGISPASYSGHSFCQGAATWAAANGVDVETIRGLGCWRSDCFRQYINKSAADHAQTTARALYVNTDWPLDLSMPAWHDF